jgi:hypothetical protein
MLTNPMIPEKPIGPIRWMGSTNGPVEGGFKSFLFVKELPLNKSNFVFINHLKELPHFLCFGPNWCHLSLNISLSLNDVLVVVSSPKTENSERKKEKEKRRLGREVSLPLPEACTLVKPVSCSCKFWVKFESLVVKFGIHS